jgi:hypothetical protein
MAENLRLARLFFVLLAIFTIGRWTLGVKGVPYDRGNPVFSLLTLTILSCIYYAAFARRWRGYRVMQAVVLAWTLMATAQVVILLATAASYLMGLDTYFNHPIALNVPGKIGLGEAMMRRAIGVFINTLLNGSIAGALGWAMGGLLPEKQA